MSGPLDQRVRSIEELTAEVARDQGETISPFLTARTADLCDETLSGESIRAEAQRQIEAIRETGDRQTLTKLLGFCESEARAQAVQAAAEAKAAEAKARGDAQRALSEPSASQQLQNAVSLALFSNTWVKIVLGVLAMAYFVAFGLLFSAVLKIQNQAGDVAEIRREVDALAEEAQDHLLEAQEVLKDGEETLADLSEEIKDIEGERNKRLEAFDKIAGDYSSQLGEAFDKAVEAINGKPGEAQEKVSEALRKATDQNRTLSAKATNLQRLFEDMDSTAMDHATEIAAVGTRIADIAADLAIKEGDAAKIFENLPARLDALLAAQQPMIDKRMEKFLKGEIDRRKSLLDEELIEARSQFDITMAKHSAGLVEQGQSLADLKSRAEALNNELRQQSQELTESLISARGRIGEVDADVQELSHRRADIAVMLDASDEVALRLVEARRQLDELATRIEPVELMVQTVTGRGDSLKALLDQAENMSFVETAAALRAHLLSNRIYLAMASVLAILPIWLFVLTWVVLSRGRTKASEQNANPASSN